MAGVIEVVKRSHDVTKAGQKVGDREIGDDGANLGPPCIHVDYQDATKARQQARRYGHYADVSAHGTVSARVNIGEARIRDHVSWAVRRHFIYLFYVVYVGVHVRTHYTPTTR